MNELQEYFRNNKGRLIQKWDHYFNVYEKHFRRFVNKQPVVVEIGVFQGGSLQMWKSYFGKNAVIYGIDIDPRCKEFEEENINIITGSQADRKFLKSLREIIPPIDILIDDGGHTMNQQICTFEELFWHIKPDGVYLCEDLHTSYWLEYGGGVRRRGTFVEYAKKFIDQLNAFHSEQKVLKVNDFTQNVDSIHFYDSILVIEKGKRKMPAEVITGRTSFENRIVIGRFRQALGYVKRKTVLGINSFLRFFNIRDFFTGN